MRWITVFFAALLTPPAVADVKTPAGKVIDCYCTDSTGSRVELGEMICLHVDGRMFMARCEMSLNNPMWREVSEGCMSSRLQSVAQEDERPRTF
ncbi:hypothetical protein CLV78_101972 [Aliiruegeria haliotis]|uniref:Uncharacterized protein n=1 Tax=Aliiruegeria haliotis TaxID=1280846 RepID=A0A2T0S0B1_9RHOB|nr:hypothetical protein [Aliiruegeria haliotis]PRY26868.1 hypothetical protein CLV78_101972 [Aliiruegeria haliotis]